LSLQAVRVGGDEEAAAGHDDDGGDGVEEAEDGEAEADGVVAEGPPQILADDAVGAAGEVVQPGDEAEVGRVQGDVGRLTGTG